MAHYHAFLGSLLGLFLCLTPIACSPPTTKEICQKHKNPSSCESALKAFAGLDPAAMTETLIDIAHENASSIQKRIHSLVEGTHDPQLIQHYSNCLDYYDDILESLNTAKKFSRDGVFRGVYFSAASSLGFIAGCDWSESKYDPTKTLTASNQHMENGGLLIMIISNMLANNDKTN